ncbi:pentatricopeptide repeat-containing protein At4g33170-like [Wolffia australiana]
MARSGEDPRRIHARLVKLGGAADRRSYNRLISLYAPPDALRLLRRLPFSPTVVSWTAAISAHSRDAAAAFGLFLSMIRRRVLPNQRTVAAALAAFSAAPAAAAQIHSLSLKLRLSPLPFAGSAILSAYCRASRPADALKVFDEIPNKDAVCYAAAVVGLAQNRRPAAALGVFAAMRAAAAPSSAYSLSAALRAAAEMAALEQTRVIHAHAVVAGLDGNSAVGTGLVDAYGKAGLVSDARRALRGLAAGSAVAPWNALLSALAQQGDLPGALEVLDEMLSRGLRPDEYTFLAVLSACGNSGRAAEAERWLSRMAADHGVAPALEHYTCLVGALARAGRLEEAEQVAAERMPFEADAAVWRTILAAGAARGDGGGGAAERAGLRLLEADPRDDSAYVLMARARAAAGRGEAVAELWSGMRRRGVKKEAGRSWVEVRGQVHEFLAGDRRHPRAAEIHAKVGEMMKAAARMGYDERAERSDLWHHSERLALACALVLGDGDGASGRLLRVVKNVRICADCHEVFGFFSSALRREIVVRDAHRYHRFRQGLCSCNGVW